MEGLHLQAAPWIGLDKYFAFRIFMHRIWQILSNTYSGCLVILGRWVINTSGDSGAADSSKADPSCDDEFVIVECESSEYEEILVEEGY